MSLRARVESEQRLEVSGDASAEVNGALHIEGTTLKLQKSENIQADQRRQLRAAPKLSPELCDTGL